MALLVPAGLFAKSLFNVSRVELGLKSDHLITFSAGPDPQRLRRGRAHGRCSSSSRRSWRRCRASTNAVFAMVPLLAGDNWNNSVRVEGFEAGPDTNTSAAFNSVGPGFFTTMGMPLMQGREFTRADAGTARRRWSSSTRRSRASSTSGPTPIGKRMRQSRERRPSRHGDRGSGPGREVQRREAPPIVAQYFTPYRQQEQAGVWILLRAHRARARAAAHRRARRGEGARSQPADRRPQDDGAADRGERVPGPHDQRVVHGLCRARDAAGGGRTLRRAGLHRRSAHARVRPADGARRGWPPGAGAGDEAGGGHGGGRRRWSVWPRPSAIGQAAQSLLFEITGADPIVLAICVARAVADHARWPATCPRCAPPASTR